jgi:hypothetical protein
MYYKDLTGAMLSVLSNVFSNGVLTFGCANRDKGVAHISRSQCGYMSVSIYVYTVILSIYNV